MLRVSTTVAVLLWLPLAVICALSVGKFISSAGKEDGLQPGAASSEIQEADQRHR